MSKKETRSFQMHPDLLYSVIKSQAGTHEKALLEAVMNAVDAGATKCVITVDQHKFTVTDDGKGFTNKQEIEQFFETFGTPHKEGDATYGRFRMGRGQLFAFAHTIWKSQEFLMDVCIKTKGLDYIFKDKQPIFSGCQIEGTWHDKLEQHQLLSLIRELKLLVKYMQIPVILNEETISLTVSEQKWDSETPEAYIKRNNNSGTLSVYNLGALVCHYPSSKFGIGGIVVAKQQLNVNFARNDVLINQCKVWKKISKSLDELLGIEIAKKTTLTDAERITMVNNLLGGKNFIHEYLNKGLFTDVNGKNPILKKVLNFKKISFSTDSYQDRIVEEKIHTQGLSFIFTHSMLDRLGVQTPQEFVTKINELIKKNNDTQATHSYYNYVSTWKPQIVDTKTLIANFKNSFELKETKTLSKKENCVLKALNEVSGIIAQTVSYISQHSVEPRKINIGISEVAEAWTDGAYFIAFADRLLNNPNPTKLIHIMIHEYCHNESTNMTHTHGVDFYELYHNVSVHSAIRIEYAIEQFKSTLLKEYTKANIKAVILDQQISKSTKLESIVA